MPAIKIERDWFFPKSEDGNLSLSTQNARITEALASMNEGDWIEIDGIKCCSRDEILEAIVRHDVQKTLGESNPTKSQDSSAEKNNLFQKYCKTERINPAEARLRIIVIICMFACLFWGINKDGGRAWEGIKKVRTERANSRTNDAPDNSFSNTDNKPQDFSWLYGKWRLTINGETQAITFNSNGTYGQVFSSPMWGTTTEFGTYEIKNDRIYLYDSADGGKHPSTIILEGHQLKEGNHYYVKSY